MAMAVMAVAAVVSAVGAVRSAQANSAAANFNAQVSERNAVVARQQAAADEARQRSITQRRLGSIRAAYGASGVTMEGTPLDLLEDSAAQAELDALTIRYKGELAAIGAGDDATLQRARAKSAREEGTWRAASALTSAAGSYYGSQAGTPQRV